MHKRTIRICLLPATLVIAACSGDDNSGGPSTPDAGNGTDASTIGDAAVSSDAEAGSGDAGMDARSADAGIDAAASDAAASDATTDAGSATDGASSDSATGDTGASLDAADSASAAPANGVYTMSNAATGNQVLGFFRSASGALTPMQSAFPTGGMGSGAGLGEQGALAYDWTANRIYAVNAGDGSFSILPVNADGTLAAAVTVSASSASLIGPKSVTLHGNTVYVLYEGNATTPSMIAGYHTSAAGSALSATPIAGSALPLSSTSESVDPAEIRFTPDGAWLVVTEKQSGGSASVGGAGSIDTFGVDDTGLATKKGFFTTASAGVDAGLQMTPYGFAFFGGNVIVSEAGSTGVGTYSYANGMIAPATPTSGGSQFLPSDPAPCWVAVSSNWAYVANAQGPDVSGFTVSASGGLANIGAVANGVVASTGKKIVTDAGTTNQGPTDETVSSDGQFLYVMNSAVPSIGIFQVHGDGELSPAIGMDYTPASASLLPVGAVSIVAR